MKFKNILDGMSIRSIRSWHNIFAHPANLVKNFITDKRLRARAQAVPQTPRTPKSHLRQPL